MPPGRKPKLPKSWVGWAVRARDVEDVWRDGVVSSFDEDRGRVWVDFAPGKGAWVDANTAHVELKHKSAPKRANALGRKGEQSLDEYVRANCGLESIHLPPTLKWQWDLNFASQRRKRREEGKRRYNNKAAELAALDESRERAVQGILNSNLTVASPKLDVPVPVALHTSHTAPLNSNGGPTRCLGSNEIRGTFPKIVGIEKAKTTLIDCVIARRTCEGLLQAATSLAGPRVPNSLPSERSVDRDTSDLAAVFSTALSGMAASGAEAEQVCLGTYRAVFNKSKAREDKAGADQGDGRSDALTSSSEDCGSSGDEDMSSSDSEGPGDLSDDEDDEEADRARERANLHKGRTLRAPVANLRSSVHEYLLELRRLLPAQWSPNPVLIDHVCCGAIRAAIAAALVHPDRRQATQAQFLALLESACIGLGHVADLVMDSARAAATRGTHFTLALQVDMVGDDITDRNFAQRIADYVFKYTGVTAYVAALHKAEQPDSAGSRRIRAILSRTHAAFRALARAVALGFAASAIHMVVDKSSTEEIQDVLKALMLPSQSAAVLERYGVAAKAPAPKCSALLEKRAIKLEQRAHKLAPQAVKQGDDAATRHRALADHVRPHTDLQSANGPFSWLHVVQSCASAALLLPTAEERAAVSSSAPRAVSSSAPRTVARTPARKRDSNPDVLRGDSCDSSPDSQPETPSKRLRVSESDDDRSTPSSPLHNQMPGVGSAELDKKLIKAIAEPGQPRKSYLVAIDPAVVKGPKKVELLLDSDQPVVFGRADDCQARFVGSRKDAELMTLSRRHAQVAIRANRVMPKCQLTVLSRNGVLHNGKQLGVGKSVMLKPGDQVNFCTKKGPRASNSFVYRYDLA